MPDDRKQRLRQMSRVSDKMLESGLGLPQETFHACLEQHPTETKVLRWDFHNFGLHYIHTYQNNWIWNQNQREFWENANFSFQILKYCLILKVFDTFSLCNLKTKHFLCLVWKRRVGERYQLMSLGTKILEFGPFWAKLWLFSWKN